MPVAIAYPFIEVTIDTRGLLPAAQRSPGVIAIVGKTPNGAGGGSAAANQPFEVATLDQAASLFASRDANNAVVPTPLYNSFRVAFLQDPKPSKMYGVRVANNNYAAALTALEAVDDVTFVALASEVDAGAAAAGGNPATNLTALKDHVESMSAQGLKRIGVAMIDPARGRSDTYVNDVVTASAGLKSSVSRMVLIAARGADGDVASAAMAAIAGQEPQISMVLKPIRGIQMPKASQYGPAEISGLSNADIIPIIDPTLIPGEGLHFAEGTLFTTDASLAYIDIVRVLDDVEFRLKAGLIGMIGDARITKQGMTAVKSRVEGILDVLLRRAVIAGFAVDIPVLSILNLPEATWTAGDLNIVQTARGTRTVDMFVSVTYGPAVHRLRVNLALRF